jgi:hypothetical protein
MAAHSERPDAVRQLEDMPMQCVVAAVCADDHLDAEMAAATLSALACTCHAFSAEVGNAHLREWRRLAEMCYPEQQGMTRHELCVELARWRAYANGLCLAGPPTLEQAVAAVAQSAKSHSYYKHLNMSRSALFGFGVSAVSGMRSVDGKFVDYCEDDGTRFHYTWMTTSTYRDRFGFLDFYDGAPGTHVRGHRGFRCDVPFESIALKQPSSTVESAARMPAYIVASSTVWVSAAVHGQSDLDHLYHRAMLYEKVVNLMSVGGREVVEGMQRQGDVCDARLQHRHEETTIRLPPKLLDAIEELERSWPALEAALAKLRPPMSSHRLLAAGRSPVYEVPKDWVDFESPEAHNARRLVREMLQRLMPWLRGAALERTAANLLSGMITSSHHLTRQQTPERSTQERIERIASIAQLVQRCNERFAMLEAAARMCGHVRGVGAPPLDIAPLFEDDDPSRVRLFGKVFGML